MMLNSAGPPGSMSRSIPCSLYFSAFLVWITCSNCAVWAQKLFLDHSTGDAVPSVSRRVSFQVIRLGMNDQGSAAVAE
jgi:hypothetical protein